MARAKKRWMVNWATPQSSLLVVEPTAKEAANAAPRLASYYNDTHNRRMLGHAQDASAVDVVAHFKRLWRARGRPLLLFTEDGLVGDADLRRIKGRTAEFAILLGDRSLQGKGLGTRFGVMVHAFAFAALGLQRLYVSIVPGNAASRKSLAKIGYEIDNSAAARKYIDDGSDLTMSVTRARFDQRHHAAVAVMRVGMRPGR